MCATRGFVCATRGFLCVTRGLVCATRTPFHINSKISSKKHQQQQHSALAHSLDVHATILTEGKGFSVGKIGLFGQNIPQDRNEAKNGEKSRTLFTMLAYASVLVVGYLREFAWSLVRAMSDVMIRDCSFAQKCVNLHTTREIVLKVRKFA